MDKYRSTKGGSGNKKMKRFPRILDYLEAHHPDVYELFDDLAMHGALTPKRGGSITFLLPDKKYVAEIRKAVESDDPEGATDMLSSLIITDLLETPADFSEKQDDIPNLLGKRIVVKGVSGNKVTVEDGELTVDSKFKPFERQGNSKRGNLAVWDLKGKIKYSGAPDATFKYAKLPMKGKKKVEGGHDSAEICKMVDTIVKDEVECIRNGTLSSDGKFKSPMLNAVARVLRVLESDAKFADEYVKARSLLTKHPIIDFYILFQTPEIFCSTKILEAYRAGMDVNNNVDTVRDFFNKTVSGDAAVLNPSSLGELIQARNALCSDVREKVNLKLNLKVIKVYEDLDEQNQLIYDGRTYFSGKIYPDVLSNIFKNNKGMHLALDEAMFFIFTAVNHIKSSTPSDQWEKGREMRAKEYASLFSTMKECFHRMGDPKKSWVSRQAMDAQDVYQTTEFWRAFGLHLPKPEEFRDEAESRVIRGGGETLDIYSKELIDVDGEIEDDLNKYDNSDFSISDSAVAELKAYLKANDGKYPTL